MTRYDRGGEERVSSATKRDQCKDRLKYISDPNRTDLRNIAKDVGCCERTAYRALKDLREPEPEEEEEECPQGVDRENVRLLYNFMNKKMEITKEPNTKELEAITAIEEELGLHGE